MRTALLLGVPAGYVATAKSAIAKNAALFSAWSIKYIPSDRKEAEILEGMIRHAQEVADRYEEPHVLGFSAQKGRQRLADQIKPYFRFRWFDHLLLKCLGSPDPTAFVEKLASDLAEECEWAVRVKPSNTNSPLLLPESSFEPTRRHRDLWRPRECIRRPSEHCRSRKCNQRFSQRPLPKSKFQELWQHIQVGRRARQNL